MRAILALLLVGFAAAPATANPRSRDLSPPRTAPSRDMREAVPTPPTMRSEPGRPSSPVKPPLSPRAAVGTESQQLWNSLRGKVYDQMPHGGNDLALSYRLMPMVINGAPALGLCGSF